MTQIEMQLKHDHAARPRHGRQHTPDSPSHECEQATKHQTMATTAVLKMPWKKRSEAETRAANLQQPHMLHAVAGPAAWQQHAYAAETQQRLNTAQHSWHKMQQNCHKY
jgi:hypothetical protein